MKTGKKKSGLSIKDRLKKGREFQSTTLDLPAGVSRFRLEGTKPRKIDIIPYVVGKGNPAADEGETWVERTFHQHRGIGPQTRAMICLSATYGKPCPICEERKRLIDEGGEENEKLAKALKPSKRNLWNVIDVENREAGIQVWDVSDWYFMEALNTALDADEDDQFRDFSQLTNGHSLRLTVEPGQSGGKNDLKIARVDFFPRKKQYSESLKKEAVCLDEVLKPLSYKELKRVFLQEPEEEDDDSSSSSKKGSKMKRTKNAKKLGITKGATVEHPELGTCVVTAIAKDGFTVTLEDEDEDTHKNIDVAALTLADEEEEEAPKKRGRGRPPKAAAKKGKKAKDEDEEEEDSDEEDEESDDDEDEDSDDEDSDDEESDEDEDSDDEDSDDDDEDDDDSELDDDDEEEEEEPKPKRGKAKKGRK